MNIMQMINAIKTSSTGATSPPIKYVYNTYMFILSLYCYVDIQVDFYFKKKPNRLVDKSLLL